jgi:glutamate-1-semialdehyde 2,1-aminomutase
MNGQHRIDRALLARTHAAELDRFRASNPRSAELFAAASGSLLGGVPMNWMRRWPGGFPLFVAEAGGAHFVDVDGHEYVDFCLGDTGAMAGHETIGRLSSIGPPRQGLTTMLPTEDAIWVGAELQRRFGLPRWQLAMTATDANRFVIRLARHATGRPRVLVFNGCYHGTVDEALHELSDGHVVPRTGNIGPPTDPNVTTRVVEFNDVDGLERELAHGDVALVLAEPALTNIGIVLPERGYHDALRAATRATGTLLAIDETHTICVGPGGATAAWGLEPDAFVIGKPIAGGVPAAAFGLHDEFGAAVESALGGPYGDVSGIGGTLTGSALSLAAIRHTLSRRLTTADYERMIPLAHAWADGVSEACTDADLDWSVQVLGARAEYCFGPPPRHGGEAAAIVDKELEEFMHLWALNRGVLLTPFHNMALIAPATTRADVDRHTEVFADAIRAIVVKEQ